MKHGSVSSFGRLPHKTVFLFKAEVEYVETDHVTRKQTIIKEKEMHVGQKLSPEYDESKLCNAVDMSDGTLIILGPRTPVYLLKSSKLNAQKLSNKNLPRNATSEISKFIPTPEFDDESLIGTS